MFLCCPFVTLSRVQTAALIDTKLLFVWMWWMDVSHLSPSCILICGGEIPNPARRALIIRVQMSKQTLSRCVAQPFCSDNNAPALSAWHNLYDNVHHVPVWWCDFPPHFLPGCFTLVPQWQSWQQWQTGSGGCKNWLNAVFDRSHSEEDGWLTGKMQGSGVMPNSCTDTFKGAYLRYSLNIFLFFRLSSADKPPEENEGHRPDYPRSQAFWQCRVREVIQSGLQQWREDLENVQNQKQRWGHGEMHRGTQTLLSPPPPILHTCQIPDTHGLASRHWETKCSVKDRVEDMMRWLFN